MKSRRQLAAALQRAYAASEAIRLNIGFGSTLEADYAALDAIQDRIDRLEAELAEREQASALWRLRHVRGLMVYRQRLAGVA